MELSKLLQRINQVEVPEIKKAILAYSGGMDSTLCIELLRRIYKTKEIKLVLYDIGQGADEISRAINFAGELNIHEVETVDLKTAFSEHISSAIRANASYRGYPIAAPIAKQLIAMELAKFAAKEDYDYIVEGSSGKGNDQFRMAKPISYFAPQVSVIAPVRDLNLTRGEEKDLCDYWGVPYNKVLPDGGDDVTIWCRSIASGGFNIDSEIPESVWNYVKNPQGSDTPDQPETLTLGFDIGIPVSINQTSGSLFEIIKAVNKIAGNHGIGRIDIVEDNIFGLKGREIYEASGAVIILKAHSELEYLCLTAEELEFKKLVEAKWLEMIYKGNLFHPLITALNAFIIDTQKNVSGEIEMSLFKGAIQILSRNSSKSLFSKKLRNLNESSWDQKKSEGAVFSQCLQYLALNERDNHQ